MGFYINRILFYCIWWWVELPDIALLWHAEKLIFLINWHVWHLCNVNRPRCDKNHACIRSDIVGNVLGPAARHTPAAAAKSQPLNVNKASLWEFLLAKFVEQHGWSGRSPECESCQGRMLVAIHLREGNHHPSSNALHEVLLKDPNGFELPTRHKASEQ